MSRLSRSRAGFLRSRRERITPEQVGLDRGPRRRTPGLRGEEVAQLNLEHTNLWLGPASGPRLVTYVPVDEESRLRLEKLARIPKAQEAQAPALVSAVSARG
ncbi:hypothetical protein AB0P17_33475 [Streptomyces sp. NPDC088124]|uniref:hypothetical protein n=1 Tax=Streptomyces sp. NPDC088124 TaxID=3154654 RepID=UPI00341C3064